MKCVSFFPGYWLFGVNHSWDDYLGCVSLSEPKGFQQNLLGLHFSRKSHSLISTAQCRLLWLVARRNMTAALLSALSLCSLATRGVCNFCNASDACWRVFSGQTFGVGFQCLSSSRQPYNKYFLRVVLVLDPEKMQRGGLTSLLRRNSWHAYQFSDPLFSWQGGGGSGPRRSRDASRFSKTFDCSEISKTRREHQDATETSHLRYERLLKTVVYYWKSPKSSWPRGPLQWKTEK